MPLKFTPMEQQLKTHLLRTAFLAALIAVFILALLPPPPVPEMMNSQDKVGHFMAFAALGLLGLAAWPRHTTTLVITLLACGALIEVAQMMTVSRQAETLDWLADAAGVAAAAMLWSLRQYVATPARS